MASQADDIAAALRKELSQATKELVLEVTANLIETTPVDTGWARSNWVPSIGDPHMQTDGSPTAPSSGAQQAGQAAIVGYDIADGPAFTSNNVPYIQRLNDGSSDQAPSGFVERAIEQGVQTVQQRHVAKVDL